MHPVTATPLGSVLIFDYGDTESPMRLSNIRSDATANQLRAFGQAVNALQRTSVNMLYRENRTELSSQ